MKNSELRHIKKLNPIQAVRTRPGMFVGDVTVSAAGPKDQFGHQTSPAALTCHREIVDNATDEIKNYGDLILDYTDFNGYNMICDNGRGVPINLTMLDDGKQLTEAKLSITELHAGSNFDNSKESLSGMNGVGSSATNFLSTRYILLSRIGEHNWNISTPEVRALWEKSGPRSKKDLYYIVVCERGEVVYESAHKLKDISKMIFKDVQDYREIPEGFSTIVLFKLDPEVFENTNTVAPTKNLENFIQIGRAHV